MDFAAPLIPVADYHPADRAVRKLLGSKLRFVWPKESLTVPCPTRGALDLIDSAFSDEGPHSIQPIFLEKLQPAETSKAIVNMLSVGLDASEKEKSAALTKKFEAFAQTVVKNKRSAPATIIFLNGPARSAKSTLARLYVSSRLKSALVYVPSAKLRKEWQAHATFAQHAEVLTRHSVSKRRKGYQVGIIDEVFNFAPRELEYHVRLLRAAGCSNIILLGDQYQREAGGIDLTHRFLQHGIQLHTSLGMPLDAHYLYRQLNNLDADWYDTTGTVEHSVFFTPQPPSLKADLVFALHQHANKGDTSETIGKSQGARAEIALFHADNNLKRTGWVHENSSRLSVAYTRHSRALVIHCSGPVADSLAGRTKLQPYHGVGARRPDLEHTLHPRAADDLVVPVRSTKVTARLTKLRAVMANPLVLEGHAVVIPTLERDPEAIALERKPLRADLVGFIDSQCNFELPDPSERDLHTAANRRPVTFCPPGPPVVRTDVRNDLPRSHLLAAIQVNSSGFDSLKNLLDRQVATTKAARFGTPDMIEGKRIYDRFVKCYYRNDATILHVEKAVSWLAETEVNALNAISSAYLGETSATLCVDAEFKTQTKAKAQASFAATLPYGQSILANTKEFNAFFCDIQPSIYLNAAKLLRDDVIMDYGMSDDELSAKLRQLGKAIDMNGANNIQADVSKQDSSHTAALLYAFILICKDCGVDNEKLEFYLAYAMRYRFRSRGVDATKSTVSFNLGSGDPFTLIRNDIMELCVIACRYRDAETMTIVEKGDDVHGVIASMAPHPMANSPSIRQVKLTVDYGIVGYHAGRFHNGSRYLVDPVRAFLKHFTRLSDSNVTNNILYTSYISRATDYSPEEVDFLQQACQVHYPHYSSDQVATMIQTMLSLRDRREFEKYSVIRIKPHVISVDTQACCASNCVRAVRPGRTKEYYRKFMHLPADSLHQLLLDEGIDAVLAEPGKTVDRGVIAITATHARVEVDNGTFKTPPNPHQHDKDNYNGRPSNNIRPYRRRYDGAMRLTSRAFTRVTSCTSRGFSRP